MQLTVIWEKNCKKNSVPFSVFADGIEYGIIKRGESICIECSPTLSTIDLVPKAPKWYGWKMLKLNVAITADMPILYLGIDFSLDGAMLGAAFGGIIGGAIGGAISSGKTPAFEIPQVEGPDTTGQLFCIGIKNIALKSYNYVKDFDKDFPPVGAYNQQVFTNAPTYTPPASTPEAPTYNNPVSTYTPPVSPPETPTYNNPVSTYTPPTATAEAPTYTPPATAEAPTYNNPVTASTKVICPFCNKKLPEDALYCSQCGKKIEKLPQKLFCTECGAEMELDALFCCKCGHKRSI